MGELVEMIRDAQRHAPDPDAADGRPRCHFCQREEGELVGPFVALTGAHEGLRSCSHVDRDDCIRIAQKRIYRGAGRGAS